MKACSLRNPPPRVFPHRDIADIAPCVEAAGKSRDGVDAKLICAELARMKAEIDLVSALIDTPKR